MGYHASPRSSIIFSYFLFTNHASPSLQAFCHSRLRKRSPCPSFPQASPTEWVNIAPVPKPLRAGSSFAVHARSLMNFIHCCWFGARCRRSAASRKLQPRAIRTNNQFSFSPYLASFLSFANVSSVTVLTSRRDGHNFF